MKRVLVLGGNFAGVTASLELKRKLKDRAEVTVLSPNPNFLYIPSLIWVPFGRRRLDEISFPVGPVLEKRGVRFVCDAAEHIEVQRSIVRSQRNGDFEYDYLVIATGASLDFSVLPGLEPQAGHIQNIVTPPLAEQAYEAYKKLVASPGPVVVGATQGASCMGAAYEYLFNLDRQLRKDRVRKKVKLTWITPEPFLGHFGIGGITGGEKMLRIFMKMYDIDWRVNTIVDKIEDDRLVLRGGEELPYAMSMLMPPFRGARVVQDAPGDLADEKGFIPADDGYRHVQYSNVYAAGLAVQVPPPFQNCAAPFGVPKTGFPSDVMGKIVAHNILRDITGKGKYKRQAFGKIPGICIMDAGSKEVWILTNHLFKPRQFELMIPNVIYNFGKLMLEKYMLWKNRRGLAWLP